MLSSKSGNPTFADYIRFVALSPFNLQCIVDNVFNCMKEWPCYINVNKSSIIVFSKRKRPPDVGIMYGKDLFEQTNSADHLGIKQESNLKIINRIIERCHWIKPDYLHIFVQENSYPYCFVR